MEKAILSLFLLTYTFGFQVQNLVDTEPHNKRPLLEFLGVVQSQWCPYGHEKEYESEAVVDAVFIGFHAGEYAITISEQLDLRTDISEAIQVYCPTYMYPTALINSEFISGYSVDEDIITVA